MSEEKIRNNELRAFWFGIAICLVPLVPYALRGGA